jgi:hypothetical protein
VIHFGEVFTSKIEQSWLPPFFFKKGKHQKQERYLADAAIILTERYSPLSPKQANHQDDVRRECPDIINGYKDKCPQKENMRRVVI